MEIFLILAAIMVLVTVGLSMLKGIPGALLGCAVTALLIYGAMQYAHK